MPEQQPMFDDRPPDLTEQIAELEREIKARRRVYPRLIGKGTLSPQISAYRIRCLEATIEHLCGVQKIVSGELDANGIAALIRGEGE